MPMQNAHISQLRRSPPPNMMPGTSSTPAHPPLDGSIPVLPGFLDFHAKHNPGRPWVLFSSPSNTEVTSVSFSDFASATHRIAHALRPNRTGAENAVVGVLVQCDVILYITLLVGMIRAGLVVSVCMFSPGSRVADSQNGSRFQSLLGTLPQQLRTS